MDKQNKAIIKSLAQMAWADGEVTEEERAMLFSVCLQLGADPDEVDELQKVLGQSEAGREDADGEDLKSVLPDKASRLNVMRVLLTMSFVDGALAFAEYDVIEKKAKELGVTPEELETLRGEALAAAESINSAGER